MEDQNRLYLLITLGHNSSCIAIWNNITAGYENERLTRVKSDSKFPREAIDKCLEVMQKKGINQTKENTTIFASHWFDFIHLKSKVEPHFNTNLHDIIEAQPNNKYCGKADYSYMEALGEIISHTNRFTHHDAHAYSAISFFSYYFKKEFAKKATYIGNNKVKMSWQANTKTITSDVHIIVADGFGNNAEVLSIYKGNISTAGDISDVRLIAVKYGYANSLGLVYQYATSFLGMKENQDEYKLLGYEPKIHGLFNTPDIERIEKSSAQLAQQLKITQGEYNRTFETDEGNLVNTDYLNRVKEYFYELFAVILQRFNIKKENSSAARILIAFYVQSAIEIYMQELIKEYDIENLIVTGGVFMNVKLNNICLNSIQGLFCANPLAGDQGAAIGFYQKYVGEQFDWGTLAIGERELPEVAEVYTQSIEGATKTDIKNEDMSIIDIIVDNILQQGIVDYIGGNMEFGARALCHTSTLCLPNKYLAIKINAINNRDNVMPFAPVLLEENLHFFFNPNEYERVVGSLRFMIVALNYRVGTPVEVYGGAMHLKPNSYQYTGRPQVIYDSDENNITISNVLRLLHGIYAIRMLINTSFNIHGEPIIYDCKNAINSFDKQCKFADVYMIEDPLLIINSK